MKPITNFGEVMEYLERFHVFEWSDYNLDNMLALMEYLGHPENDFKTVHIAGTSGKTSTSYYMSALLAASGKKVGLTVSPHVTEINERVQINGQPLPESTFCKAITEFLELIDKAPVTPTWFEVMVAFAYWYFSREGVDYVVTEVGLGGLKDGTNVISRQDKVCVITDIGLDHVNVLGDTIEEIAAQKIGIVHEGNTVFTYRQAPEIMEVFSQWTQSHGAELNIVEEAEARAKHEFEASLPDYQQHNWTLAVTVYNRLAQRDGLPNLTSKVLQETQETVVPGRMDIRQVKGKTVVMDGAHNGQKVQAFADSFQKLYPDTKPAILIGLKQGKEAGEVAQILAPLASRVVTTSFAGHQDTNTISLNSEELADEFKSYLGDVKAIDDRDQALQEILTGPEQVIVIIGSLYLLSQIRNNKQL